MQQVVGVGGEDLLRLDVYDRTVETGAWLERHGLVEVVQPGAGIACRVSIISVSGLAQGECVDRCSRRVRPRCGRRPARENSRSRRRLVPSDARRAR